MEKLKLTSAVLGIALASYGVGQQVVSRSSGGYGVVSAYNKLYAQGTVVEFSGKVTGVQRAAPMRGMDAGFTMLVKSPNGGTSMVDLGPAWYIDQQKPGFKVGDRVKVSGSKVKVQGTYTILAQKVTKNNRVLYLRGEDGWPMWVAYRGHVEVRAANTVRGNTLIEGTIRDITTIPNGQSGGPSTALVIEGNGQIYTLDMGPVWYFDRQDMFLEIGNVIVATGTPFNNGFYGVIDLRRGTDFFRMRDQFGRPLWQQFGGG